MSRNINFKASFGCASNCNKNHIFAHHSNGTLLVGWNIFAGQMRPSSLIARRYSAGAVHMKEIVDNELDMIRQAGTWKNERVITSPQAANIKVLGSQSSILNFCANNYLGLSVSLYLLYSSITSFFHPCVL